MGRSPCCSKDEVNRGAWTAIEDKTLTEYIKTNGEGKWRSLPKKAGLKRCGKSCRLRWLNYLRPGIKRGNITNDEEELIIRLHKLLGNRWSLIAGRLPGRTDNEVKNYWNTIIGKKLQNPQKYSSSHEDHAAPSPNIRANSDHGVVWTRPTRCSKVTIPPELLDNDDLQQRLDVSKPIIAPTPASSISAPHDENSPLELLKTQFSVDCNDSSDLVMDFELDEQFLSDFLDTDFSQLTKFEHGAASDVCTISDQQGKLYPNSNQTNFFEENALHDDSNFLSADSLIESEFDWVV